MARRKNKSGGGNRGARVDYAVIEKTNQKFEEYYNSLQILPADEKEAFWETLRRDLPNSFRFTGSRKHALAVQERLKDHYIPNITSIRYEGELVEPPRPLPWYPDQLAWSMTTPKQVVRRFPPFASFHKFLVSETEVGNISRQEVVSMIPPLLLDVRPGMVVLDMCAAPGSKSAQLMEMVHAGEEENLKKVIDKLETEKVSHPREKVGISDLLNDEVEESNDFGDDGRSTGLLIANDSDYKRAHMLIHQMKRLNSPNLLVTNHDATMFPSIRLPSPPPAEGKFRIHRYLKFDRILADVPCSGDGTARKNINVWKDWNPANAIGLHPTQNRILVRALQMLKPGGRVVYSTCSMNPIENEAVIASAIDRCGGLEKVEIIDCSNELQGLKRYPGLTSWSVIDKQGRIWKGWNDVEQELAQGDESLKRIVEGMFPPQDAAIAEKLSKCMRVYPHQQDTGGFFITVLEKKGEIKARPEGQKVAAAKAPESTESKAAEADSSVADSTVSEPNPPSSTENGHTVTPEHMNLSSKRSADHFESESEKKRSRISGEEVVPSLPTSAENGHSDALESAVSSEKQSKDRCENEPDTKHIKASDEVTVGGNVDAPAISQPKLPEVTSLRSTKQRSGQQFEEAFKYLDPHHQEFDTIFEFYRISPQFPRDRFMVRNPEGRPIKTIYYTTALARDILTENEGSGIKFVHCGVKMFVKQDVQRQDVCPWRIQKDGLTLLEPWAGTERTVRIYKKQTLRRLLVEMFPKVNDGGWKTLGELGEWARDVDMGCCILKLEPTDGYDGFHERMVLPLWRSLHSLNLMLPKEERRAMLLRLFNDQTPLINTTQKRELGEAATNTPQGVDSQDDDTPAGAEESAETPAAL